MWLIIIPGVIAVLWLQWRYKNRRLLQFAEKIPGPKPLPVIGNALHLMCRPEEMLDVLMKLVHEYGDVLRFWLGPDLNVVVMNPDDLKVNSTASITTHGFVQILLTSPKTSQKGPQYKYITDVSGDGIGSSGPVWRRHRKIALPNYGKRATESYGDIFHKEIEYLLQKYRNKKPNEEYELYDDIVLTTSYSVCQTLIGMRRDEVLKLPHLEDIIHLTPEIYDIIFNRIIKWWQQIEPVFWMTRAYSTLKSFKGFLWDFGREIIKSRLEVLQSMAEERKQDLLNTEEDSTCNTELSVIDRFLLSQELNTKELVDETFTIFTSSQEAAAKISSFILLMMAYHPEYQEKLYLEIMDVMGDSRRCVTEEDLKRMTYLDMVFKEVLRLFPTGAMLQRTVMEDIEISTGTLPAGCSLVAPIYHLQRDPRHWTRPDEFDPERFTPENCKRRHPHCYIPFSLGPMDCIGRFFGAKLIKTLCVQVLREFRLSSLQTYSDMRLVIAVSVASVTGHKVLLTPRKQLIN